MSRQVAELKTKLSKIAWIQSEGIKSIGFTKLKNWSHKQRKFPATLSQSQGVIHVFPLAVHLDKGLLVVVSSV